MQKRVSKFFACSGLFLLWRHWKPLKTVETAKNRWIFKNFSKIVKVLKKRTPKIFRLRWPFFQKSPRSILRKCSVKEVGVQKHTWIPLNGVWSSKFHIGIWICSYTSWNGISLMSSYNFKLRNLFPTLAPHELICNIHVELFFIHSSKDEFFSRKTNVSNWIIWFKMHFVWSFHYMYLDNIYRKFID